MADNNLPETLASQTSYLITNSSSQDITNYDAIDATKIMDQTAIVNQTI